MIENTIIKKEYLKKILKTSHLQGVDFVKYTETILPSLSNKKGSVITLTFIYHTAVFNIQFELYSLPISDKDIPQFLYKITEAIIESKENLSKKILEQKIKILENPELENQIQSEYDFEVTPLEIVFSF